MTTRQEAARWLANVLQFKMFSDPPQGEYVSREDVAAKLLSLVADEPGEATGDGIPWSSHQLRVALAAERERADKAEAEVAALKTKQCSHGWRGYSPENGDRIVTPCPSCGMKSLFIATGGHLTCGNLGPSCQAPAVGDCVDTLKAERDALKATVERVRELLRASPSYTLSRAQIEGALAPVGGEGQSEPVYVVLTNDRNSPNQVFVEIETASGESVRIDGGAYPDDPNLWRIGPLYRAPALDVEAAARVLSPTPKLCHMEQARAILSAATRTK